MKRPLAWVCLFFSLLLALSARFSENYEIEYSRFDDQKVTVEGTVLDIMFKPKENYDQEIIYLKEGIICYMDSTKDYCEPPIGSRITVSGQGFLFDRATNPGQFNAYEYYATINMHVGINKAQILKVGEEYSPLKYKLYLIRRAMSTTLDNALPREEAAVMKTMLLGEKSQMDPDLKKLYQRNGIAHVLAISGLHISLLGLGIYKLFRHILGLSIRLSAITSSLIVMLYGIMTGFSPSSVRAIFMFSLSMLASFLGRTYDMVTAVALAAFLLLLDNPLYIHNSGFVFSFGCVIGIALLLPVLTTSCSGKRLKGIISLILSSLSLSVASLPIYLYFYYQLPVYSMFLNFLVIPVMSILVPSGILVIILEHVCPIIGIPFQYLVIGILRLFTILSTKIDTLPGHYFTPGKPTLVQVFIYIAILSLVVVFKKQLRLKAKWGLVLVAALILCIRLHPPMELTFLDVGQGDCIFLRSEGFTMLVDGGSTSVKNVGEYRIIPFLKERGAANLNMVVVTHPDEDHMNGIIELLKECTKEGIKIDCLGLSNVASLRDEDGYRELEELALRCGAETTYLNTGMSIRCKELNIDVLSPPKMIQVSDSNEASVVLRIEHDEFSALLTGDLEGTPEQAVASLAGNVDLLKVAHHGSKNSTGISFLNSVKPKLAVISAGENNRYGHPHNETLDRLDKIVPDCQVFRTDESGAITVLPPYCIRLFNYKNSISFDSN